MVARFTSDSLTSSLTDLDEDKNYSCESSPLAVPEEEEDQHGGKGGGDWRDQNDEHGQKDDDFFSDSEVRVMEFGGSSDAHDTLRKEEDMGEGQGREEEEELDQRVLVEEESERKLVKEAVMISKEAANEAAYIPVPETTTLLLIPDPKESALPSVTAASSHSAEMLYCLLNTPRDQSVITLYHGHSISLGECTRVDEPKPDGDDEKGGKVDVGKEETKEEEEEAIQCEMVVEEDGEGGEETLEQEQDSYLVVLPSPPAAGRLPEDSFIILNGVPSALLSSPTAFSHSHPPSLSPAFSSSPSPSPSSLSVSFSLSCSIEDDDVALTDQAKSMTIRDCEQLVEMYTTSSRDAYAYNDNDARQSGTDLSSYLSTLAGVEESLARYDSLSPSLLIISTPSPADSEEDGLPSTSAFLSPSLSPSQSSPSLSPLPSSLDDDPELNQEARALTIRDLEELIELQLDRERERGVVESQRRHAIEGI